MSNKEIKKEDIIIAYKHKFGGENDPLAETVLKDLENYCGYNSRCFVPGKQDMTNFALGARDVYLHILEMLDATTESIKPKKAITESED